MGDECSLITIYYAQFLSKNYYCLMSDNNIAYIVKLYTFLYVVK